MDFPKKQAQRLIPLHLLDYATQLQISHPDPTESWGGGTYTAGDGIDITNDVISVDDTIAKKSEIPTNYVTLDTEQTITMPKRIDSRLSIGSETGNSIFIDGKYGSGMSPLISMYNDTLGSELSIMIDNGNVQGNTGAYFTYEDDKGLREYKLPYQDATGLNKYTLATTSDIPTVNNPTITFTQGGVTKGSISLNQSTDQTIDLDAGGSGGSSVVANPTLSGNEATLNGLEVDGTKYKVGGSGGKLYRHNITVVGRDGYSPNCYFDIYIRDNTPFTTSLICEYISNYGVIYPISFPYVSNNTLKYLYYLRLANSTPTNRLYSECYIINLTDGNFTITTKSYNINNSDVNDTITEV